MYSASRLFNHPSAITICRGCSKRAEIQRQRGIQEKTDHVYTSNDAHSPLLPQLKSNVRAISIASLMTKTRGAASCNSSLPQSSLIQPLYADVERRSPVCLRFLEVFPAFVFFRASVPSVRTLLSTACAFSQIPSLGLMRQAAKRTSIMRRS
jgi:hypothetical protein